MRGVLLPPRVMIVIWSMHGVGGWAGATCEATLRAKGHNERGDAARIVGVSIYYAYGERRELMECAFLSTCRVGTKRARLHVKRKREKRETTFDTHTRHT